MNPGDREASATAALRACRRALAEHDSNILHEVTAGAGIEDWRHYPEGEAYDPISHAQYFFHRHPAPAGWAEVEAGSDAEAGHFHLFLRADGMPAGTRPLLLPELAIADLPIPPQAAPLKRGQRDEVCHLVAIALGLDGEPVRLFTTNRWVTGETWYAADDVIAMLDRFLLDEAGPASLLDRWLEAMVRLFRPEIAALLRRRDDTVMGWRRRRRGNVFEDARLEITSSFAIDLPARLAAAERIASAPPPSRRLPRMAEGWGV